MKRHCTMLRTAFLAALFCTPVYGEAPGRLSRALLLDITVCGKQLVAVGERGTVLVKATPESPWQSGDSGTRALLTAVSFPSSEIGWATGHDGIILASGDCGKSWTLSRDGLKAQQQINQQKLTLAEQEINRIRRDLESATDPELIRDYQDDLESATLDLEDAEFFLSEPPSAPPLLSIHFISPAVGIAVGGNGAAVKTTDGGKRWDNIREQIDNPDGYHLNAITGNGRGALLIAGEAGLLWYSSDRGETWQSIPSPYEGSWFAAIHDGTEYWYIGGLRGNLYRTNNPQQGWEQIVLDIEGSINGFARGSAGEVFALGNNGLVAKVGISTENNTANKAITTIYRHPSRAAISSAQRQDDHLQLVGQRGLLSVDLKQMDAEVSGDH